MQDPDYYLRKGCQRFHRGKPFDLAQCKATLKNGKGVCVYLEGEEVNVMGLRVFGAPWQPRYFDW